MRTGLEHDRRPLLIAAVFVLLLTSGLGAWPHTLAALCPSILIASSNEKAALMTQLAQDYSLTHGSPWSGCGPAVTVENVASGDAEHQLEAGWPGTGRPDVWTPAATTWVLLLASKRPDLVPSGQNPSIAASPLVVAMPDPMAKVLGWPDYHPTWRDLLLLAQDPRGWARFGQPTWGLFRLGKTDPRTSTSGIHSLIAAYDAATGTTNPTLADINAPATTAFMTEVESSVSHYASTAGSFLDNMASADSLSYVSAVAVEEQEVFTYNEGGHSPERPREPPRIQLDAIYPAGGTFVADHPFVVLRGSWVDRAKSNVANDFLTWLREPAQQLRFTNAGFRNYLDRAIAPLSTEPGITEDQPLQLPLPTPDSVAAMSKSWGTLRKPARILMVLDLANASQRTLVHNSIGELLDKDQVAVWAVAGGQPLRILDLTPLSGGRNTVLQAIDSAPIVGVPEPLYSAVSIAYTSLRGESDAAHIEAVVIITAHRDDGSGEGLAALEREIRAQSAGPAVRIYAVAFPGSDSDSLLGIEGASGGVPSAWDDPSAAIRTSLGNF
jgi:Ca-activated chloride channel family protein